MMFKGAVIQCTDKSKVKFLTIFGSNDGITWIQLRKIPGKNLINGTNMIRWNAGCTFFKIMEILKE